MTTQDLKSKLINLAFEMGWINSIVPVNPIKMSHGPCCCCTVCGYDHDYCVCLTNEYLEKLDKIIDDIDYID